MTRPKRKPKPAIKRVPKSVYMRTVCCIAEYFYHLGTPDGAVNNCGSASNNLRKVLKEQHPGIDLECLLLREPKHPFPDRHSWYRKHPEELISHVVLRIGDTTVDLTRRQFDPKARYPHVEKLSVTKKMWGVVKPW